MIEQMLRHNADLQRQDMRQLDASLARRVEQASQEAQAAAARSQTAQMHREAMQSIFQDLTQQQAAAMSQMLATQQQTAAAAAEMRETNRDQRAFMRANEEQMTNLATMLGQHYGLSRQNLEQAVAQMMGMQREHSEGMANLIFGAGSNERRLATAGDRDCALETSGARGGRRSGDANGPRH